MFSVDIRQEALGVVLALRGDLDFDSVVQLREAGEKELAGGRQAGPPVVVDCSALTFCDSTGIGALVQLHQWLSADGRVLRLAAVPATTTRLFKITGLDKLFTLYPDATQALAADSDTATPPVQPNEGLAHDGRTGTAAQGGAPTGDT
ncbi:STAS domain-containing protein [Streptomyces sp. NPDC002886]|uniref:STAS domain-containing protein n=1 Tax=Streptomyces sp. NPDC002886 TaxID=3364667 RepID=UPI0036ACAEE8